MRRSRQLFIRTQMIALAALFAAALAPLPAQAWTLKTLYAFCVKEKCADGANPYGGVIRDGAGNLYGTTGDGGSDQFGTVFKLSPADNGKWKEKVLHSFCTTCDPVGRPFSGLIIDTAGNLYGTASPDGSIGGAVYEMVLKATGGYKFRVLYSFCAAPNCTDGSGPGGTLTYVGAAAGLPYDGHSTLFGRTFLGGALGGGVVFSLDPKGRGWKEQVLYDFCLKRSCSDSKHPLAVIADGSGNLFGTAFGDRKTNVGTLFELTPSGGQRWNENILYRFCLSGVCSDGKYPLAVGFDGAGNLLGTAESGGGNKNAGVIFKLGGDGQYSVLHTFCSAKNCADGWWPQELLPDGAGGDFGVTVWGGGNNSDEYGHGGGTVYRLDASGFEHLYSFCGVAECADGEYPRGALALDPQGNVYGATSDGGIIDQAGYGSGTVFELSP